MALMATHIRFALDLLVRYQVKDVKKYISGTIYPDSRYMSGLDRVLTHGSDVILPNILRDDFEKGWRVHQICDDLQGKTRKELFHDLLNVNDYDKVIIIHAMKIIQDMTDLKYFDIKKYLKYFKYVVNPNNENIKDVVRYYRIIFNFYKNNKEITINDYYKMWLKFGIDKEYGGKVKSVAETLMRDADFLKRLELIYDEMILSCK